MKKTRFQVPSGVVGRIDKVLADSFPDFSRSHIKRAIEEGRVLSMEGSSVNPKTKVSSSDEFWVDLSRPQVESLRPYKYPLKILFENDSLIVLDKDPGMVVHPGDGTGDDTLVHALLHHCPDGICPVGAPERPGVVHRLDKDTSGVMVVAKTESAYFDLVDQFSQRKTEKKYTALVAGKMMLDSGRFDGPIGRHPKNRVKMTVRDDGKEARTDWRVTKRFKEGLTLIECIIHSGRTHQIRVHFANAGYPLVGDITYGFKPSRYSTLDSTRVLLHATKLIFKMPDSEELRDFHAPLPQDFLLVINSLREI